MEFPASVKIGADTTLPHIVQILLLSRLTVVSRKYAPPPFATLVLVQSTRGAYTWDVTFSLAITPPPSLIEKCLVVLWMLASFLRCHSTMETLDLLDCVGVATRGGGEREARGVAERRTRGGEMLSTLAVGWRASVLRGKEAGHFCEVVGVSIVAEGDLHSI